eukprot:9612342-Alexandrium_andersonii.AAC.1
MISVQVGSASSSRCRPAEEADVPFSLEAHAYAAITRCGCSCLPLQGYNETARSVEVHARDYHNTTTRGCVCALLL